MEVVAAKLPAERAVAGRRQAHFAAEVGLGAQLVLDAIASGRAVGAEGRAGGRREDEGHRDRTDCARGIDRIAGIGRGRGEALGHRRLGGRVGRTDVAGKVGGGAIGNQVLLDVRVERPGGQLHLLEFVLDLDRGVEAGLVVGRSDVVVEPERVLVHVLIKGRVDAGKIGQRKSRVERQRGAVEFGIANLGIDLGGAVHPQHHPAIERPAAVVIDHGRIVEEDVAVEPVRPVIHRRDDIARAIAQRPGHVPGGRPAVVLAIGGLDPAGQVIGRLQGLDHDRAGRSVAAIDRALRTLEDFDLAQCALILIELGRVGLENAVDYQRDRAFGIARAVHAADVDLGVARLGRAGDDSDAGRQLGEVLGAGGAGALDRRGGDHGHRGRGILQPFRLAARGNNNRPLIVSGGSATGLSLRGIGESGEAEHGTGKQPRELTHV